MFDDLDEHDWQTIVDGLRTAAKTYRTAGIPHLATGLEMQAVRCSMIADMIARTIGLKR